MGITDDYEKKKAELKARKAGQDVGKGAEKGVDAVKGFGKGLKDAAKKGKR